MSRHIAFRNAVILLVALAAVPAWAGFAGTDVFLPSVGAKPGVAPAVWYTTMWVHNPNATAANITVYLLERQANPAPLSYTDTIPAGDTRKFENAVQTMFARQTFGALRVTSNVKVIVGSRIYSQSGDLDDSVGQYFAGTPASFAIGAGQSTELLGGYGTVPATSSTFRYNFGFVETTGTGTCQVRVTVKDDTGAEKGSKSYAVRQWEQMQKSFKDEFPSVSTQNARLSVAVTSGTGKVIAFGSAVANGSQDPATFEMAFRDSLLAENSSGGGLSEVSHDGTLEGAGTTTSLLGIADGGVSAGHIAAGQVVKSLNGLKDAVTLTAGSNVSITPSGNTLTIAATGGSGGSGVPSVNGITSAVTIAGSGGATVSTSGNTITIGASGASGGVPSVNGITSAVTIAGTGTASVSTVGGTVTVNGSGLSAVTPGTGLTGTGTPGSPLGIGNGGVGTNQLADGGVTKGKLSVSGGSAGQVLGTDGSQLVWSSPGGLALPYEGQGPEWGPAFKVTSNSGWALAGYTTGGTGVYGDNSNSNTVGHAGFFNGRVHVTRDLVVDGTVSGSAGPYGAPAVTGNGGSLSGVFGNSSGTVGAVAGRSTNGTDQGSGVAGYGDSYSNGVWGHSVQGHGVVGSSEGYGGAGQNAAIYGFSYSHGWAGFFNYDVYVGGYVQVMGSLHVAGTKDFRIDHPLDPENRYLHHAAIESNEVLDQYSGNVMTDDQGLAVVQFPEWFEALNTDFRYQLTVIGRFAQAIVEKKVDDNRFTIRTNVGGVEVSWQVTARRNDAWMKAHPFEVERDKPAAERGTYLSPAEWGQPKEKSAHWSMLDPAGGPREAMPSFDAAPRNGEARPAR